MDLDVWTGQKRAGLTKPGYESAGDELSKTVARALYYFANHPQREAQHQRFLAAQIVSKEDGQNGREEAAQIPCSHDRT